MVNWTPGRLMLLLAALWLLVACQSAAPEQVASPILQQPAPANTSSAIQPSAPTAEPLTGVQTEVPAAIAPSPGPTATIYTGPELHASDPSTVNLASGNPKLVEFFAFW